MILHIGGNHVIFIRDIVAIINETCMKSNKISREMLEQTRSKNRLIGQIKDAASFIIVQEDGEHSIYCSSISCSTLRKRCNFPHSFHALN